MFGLGLQNLALGGYVRRGGPVVQTVSFGALTLAGAGGLAKPAGATTISDAGGTNLVLSSGLVVPDTGGTVTSGTLVFDDGSEWTVTATPDTYSVRTTADWEAWLGLSDGTIDGTTVVLRPAADIDYGGTGEIINRTFATGVTIRSEDAARPARLYGTRTNATDDGMEVARLAGTANVAFEDVTWYGTFDRRFSNSGTPLLEVKNAGATNIAFRRCTFQGSLLTQGAGFDFRGINLDSMDSSAALTVEDCTFDQLGRAFFAGEAIDRLTFVGNTITNFGSDAISIGPAATKSRIAYNVVKNPLNSAFQVASQSGLKRASELAGASDSTRLTLFSCWRPSVHTGAANQFLFDLNGAVQLYRNTSGQYRFIAKDTGGATVVDMTSAGAYLDTNTCGRMVAVLVSVDTGGTSRIYVWDEIDRTWVQEATATAAGQTLDLTAGGCALLTDYATEALHITGRGPRVAYWQGVAADIASGAVRDAFIDDPSFEYIEPRETSVALLGTPIVDFVGDLVTVWRAGANQGSGGDFTDITPDFDVSHADGLQSLIGVADLNNLELVGNIFHMTRDDAIPVLGAVQLFFMEDTGGNANVSPDVIGNVGFSNRTIHGISGYNFQDGRVVGNAILAVSDGFAGGAEFGNSPAIQLQNHSGGTTSGNLVADNVAYQVSAPADATATILNNLDLNAAFGGTVTDDYPTIFAGSDFSQSAIGDVADMLTAIGRKGSGALDTAVPQIGPAGYVDFTNRRIDHPRVNRVTMGTFTDVTGATASSTVTSGAVQVTGIAMYDDDGGTATASAVGAVVHVDAGEFRITSDAEGASVVTDWTDADAIIEEGEYLWLRRAAATVHSTATAIALTVGDHTDEWTITTDSTPVAVGVLGQQTYATNQTGAVTISGASLGPADSARTIAVAIGHRNGSTGQDHSNVTVGGVSATKVAESAAGSQLQKVSIWVANVPTGTTGDIVVTPSGTVGNLAVSWAYLASYASVSDSAALAAATRTSGDLSVDVADGEAVFGMYGAELTGADSYTVTGATEFAEGQGAAASYVSFAHGATGAEAPRTVAVAHTSATSWGAAIVAAPASASADLTMRGQVALTNPVVGAALGTASAGRHIVVAVSHRNSSTSVDHTAVTVGGVSATKIAESETGAQQRKSTIWIANVPTGTTGDIALTASGGTGNLQIAWASVESYSGVGDTAAGAYTVSTTNVDLSLDVADGAAVFATASVEVGSTGQFTVTGATEYGEVAGAGACHVVASHNATAAETPRTIGAAHGTGNSWGVAVALQP